MKLFVLLATGITSAFSLDLSSEDSHISDSAYQRDTSFTSVQFPSTLETIGKFAFGQCEITSLDFSGTNLKIIDEGAFQTNRRLASVQFPSTLETIGKNAFTNCNITSLDLSGTRLMYIGESAFSYCPISELVFPSTLKTIGRFAFAYRSSLTSVVFPSSLTSIGSFAFFDTPITSVTYHVDDCSETPTIGSYYTGNYTYLKDGKDCAADDQDVDKCDTDDSATYIENQCCACTS